VADVLPLCSPSLSVQPVAALGPVFGADGPPGWFGPWVIVLGLAVLALLGLGLLCRLRPLLPLRAVLWLITHTVYRLDVSGRENVPETGGALIVCNHVSFLDWLLLMATLRRPVRFVVFGLHARSGLWRRVLRWAGAIPIDGSGGLKSIVKSLRLAGDALARGELVCLFAEGARTRTGFLLSFHRAFEQILKRSPAPIIPACLDQLWGSAFRSQGGKAVWRRPQVIPYPVTVAYGPALPSGSRAAEVRLAIQRLSAGRAASGNRWRLPVHRQFVRTAARHPLRPCLIDPGFQLQLNYARSLAGAWILARHLRPVVGDEAMVGVWLPPGAGAAVCNISLALLGKTSVNLNYTSSAEFVQAAARLCGLRHVLTARRFCDRLKPPLGPDVELVYLDDIRPKVSPWEQILRYLTVLLLPGFVLDRWVLRLGRQTADDLATVVFSSGSTGEPKGVMLTHGNIAANVGSMIQAMGVTPADRALGILPFFHSFGYTVTLWAPLQVGASLVYYPDPRQSKEIGELCRTHRCTIFLATPTFLRFCLRRCEPDDFRTLRILMCGAEKLSPSLAEEFREKFGVQPLEGYGCTELSPVAAANVPDVEVDGARQVHTKPGTIGQPVPGVAARVVDPDTLAEVPSGEEGLLLVSGANVMRGYLGQEEKTREVVRDGWYVTGDMARFDEDGFLVITGRLSRFAKVGGEMVPLQRIEEELHGILRTSDQVCAVTAVPDEKKGERVVVLHLELQGIDVCLLSEQLCTRGLPNLGLPGERDFYQIEEMPLLGSGKLDLKRLKELALELAYTNGR
jgi:acyl-[acyl-carrier-protein]-phospholipid O-acyltransferase/long-chain-fatty-acid--[acyl-carrier-protein] ligase